MISTEVRTVADITDAHRGWLIKVLRPPHPESIASHQTFVLGKGFGSGVRRWTRPSDGAAMVGLVDDITSPGVVGTERAYPAGTPCELIRPVSRAARRAHRAQLRAS